jgi:hypothetical protein
MNGKPNTQITSESRSHEATCSIDPAAGSGRILLDAVIYGHNGKAIAALEAKIAEKRRHIGTYYTPQAIMDHMDQIQSTATAQLPPRSGSNSKQDASGG